MKILYKLYWEKHENLLKGNVLNHNRIFKKITKIEITKSKDSPSETVANIRNILLHDADLIVKFNMAAWALRVNIYIEESLKMMKDIDNNKEKLYCNESASASVIVDLFNGKYGGWKRDERYPDLSEYEDKMIDE